MKKLIFPLLFICKIHAMEAPEQPTFFRPVLYVNGKLKNLINQNWQITPTNCFNPNLKLPLLGLGLLCSVNLWIMNDPHSYCNNVEVNASDCVSKAIIENLWELIGYYSFEQLTNGSLGYIFIVNYLSQRLFK